MAPLVIVLAGGIASRIGSLGDLLPKSMLPISNSETSLSRLLDQLTAADFRRVVISTSTRQHALLKSFVETVTDSLSRRRKTESLNIDIVENSKHALGPLPALAEIVREFPSERYILCLADIVFRRNPFLALTLPSTYENGANLIVAPYSAGLGGVVVTSENNVQSLHYEPLDRRASQKKSANEMLFNWAGSAVFGANCRDMIVEFCSRAGAEPLEAAFNHLIDCGTKTSIVVTPHFVNLNTWQDFQNWQS